MYEARSQMGEKLARKIQGLAPALEIDIVIPIPETSRTAALTCAQVLQKPYREGFIKNRYIARTFLMPVCVKLDVSCCIFLFIIYFANIRVKKCERRLFD